MTLSVGSLAGRDIARVFEDWKLLFEPSGQNSGAAST